MGGYSLYVWPAYSLVAVVFIGNVLAIKRRKHRTRNFLQRWFKG
ncbi:MAG: heme exporter protein CcmD [Legionellales bacterium]